MGKIKEEKNWYLCAFLLPFVAGVAICIRNGVYPFGENCILHIDILRTEFTGWIRAYFR